MYNKYDYGVGTLRSFTLGKYTVGLYLGKSSSDKQVVQVALTKKFGPNSKRVVFSKRITL